MTWSSFIGYRGGMQHPSLSLLELTLSLIFSSCYTRTWRGPSGTAVLSPPNLNWVTPSKFTSSENDSEIHGRKINKRPDLVFWIYAPYPK